MNPTNENMGVALSTTNNEDYFEHYPVSRSGYDRHVIKVDLFYLDETTNQIKVIMPFFQKGGWEELYKYLAAYVSELTKYYITISHFQITIGAIKDDKEHYSHYYKKEEVPLNAVYQINWPLGAFVDPLEVKRKRLEIQTERIKKGEHPYDDYPFPYNEC